jgi:hypothetical protein
MKCEGISRHGGWRGVFEVGGQADLALGGVGLTFQQAMMANPIFPDSISTERADSTPQNRPLPLAALLLYSTVTLFARFLG